MLVNLIGSFLIGALYGFSINDRLKFILVFGFCGSLTTFSAWIVQCVELILQGAFYAVILLIFKMFFLGFLSALAGNQIVKRLFN